MGRAVVLYARPWNGRNVVNMENGTLGQSVPKSQAVMLEEVSMEKQKDQEFAHLEVKRLCGVFGAPLPPVEEKPVDKVKEPPRPYRSREREER